MKHQTMNRRRRWTTGLLVWACLASACDAPQETLEVRTTPPVARTHDVIQELRARQLLRYTRYTPTTGETQHETVGASRDVIDDLNDACDLLRTSDPESPYRMPIVGEQAVGDHFSTCSNEVFQDNIDTCRQAACFVEHQACVANLLLEIAATQTPKVIRFAAAVEEIEDAGVGDGGTARASELVFPVQSTATRAYLRELVVARTSIEAYAFSSPLGKLGEFLRPTPLDAPGNCGEKLVLTDESEEPVLVGERLVTEIHELYELSEEAGGEAVADYLAIADGSFSREAGFDRAAESAGVLRLHAASIMLGGGPVFSSAQPTLCTLPELSPEERSALELLRETGMSPAVIGDLTGVSNATLLSGQALPTLEDAGTEDAGVEDAGAPSTQLEPGLIRRIAQLRGHPELASGNAAAFTDVFGLRADDFRRPREWLAHELRAFGRLSTLTVPGGDYAVPGYGTFPKYVATATLATPAPWGKYVQTLRRAQLPVGQALFSLLQVFRGGDEPLALDVIGMGSVADMSDYVDTLMRVVRSHADATDTPAREQILESVTRLQNVVRHTHLGYAIFLDHFAANAPSSGDAIDLLVVSDEPEEKLLVTISDSAMRCAVRGNIEGTPCSANDIEAGRAPLAPPPLDPLSQIGDVEDAIEARFAAWFQIAFLRLLSSDEDGGIPETLPDAGGEQSEELRGLLAFLLTPLSNGPLRSNLSTFRLTRTIGRPAYVLRLRPGQAPGTPGAYETLGALAPENLFQTALQLMNVTSPGSVVDGGIVIPDGGLDIDASGLDGSVNIDDLLAGAAEKFPYIGYASLVPRFEAQAGTMLTPSRDWCAKARTTCGGTTFDERVALEDETIDNGDAYENSWETLLQRAEQAAAQADQLGELALSAGLEIDQTAENELASLSNLCGVPVTFDPIASMTNHGATDVLTSPALGLDPRLATCLGAAGAEPVVASLGSDDLCAWRVNGVLCDGPSPGYDCPRRPLPTDMVGGALSCKHPAGSTVEVIENNLGFFTFTPAESGAGGEMNPPPPTYCNDFREFRRSLEAPTETNTMITRWLALVTGGKGVFFSQPNFSDIASTIRWEARVGSHSTLHVEDKPFLTTGNIDGSGTSSDMCTGGYTQCPANDPSLMCDRVNCADIESRARLSGRWARAATYARYLAGRDLNGFIAPDRETTFPKKTTIGYPFTGAVSRLGTVSSPSVTNQSYWCLDATDGEESRNSVWFWTRPEGGESFYDSGFFYLCSAMDGVRFGTFPHPFGHYSINQDHARLHVGLAREYLENFATLAPVDGGTSNWLSLATALQGDGDGYVDAPGDVPLPWVRGHSEEDNPTDKELVERMGMAYWSNRHDQLHATGVLDAIELVCEASMMRQGLLSFPPPSVQSAEDALREADRMDDAAREIGNQASMILLEGLPANVVDALGSGGSTAVGISGEIGAQTQDIRAALIDLSIAPGEIEDAVHMSARTLRVLTNTLAIEDAQESVAKTRMMTGISDQANKVVQSITRNQQASSGPSAVGPRAHVAGAISVASDISNAVNQIMGIIATYRQEVRIANAQRDNALASAESGFAQVNTTLRAASARLESSASRLQAGLERLEATRQSGRRNLDRALFLDRSSDGTVFRSNTVLRRRLSTARARYEASRDDAIRMAFVARQAVEQRFGVRLASMRNRMTLVDAPAAWESSLCELDGIDYARIRNADTSASDGDAENYSDGYLGDWVQKLRRFTESYRIDFPFQNGQDSAVVSLRDDVQHTRAVCAVDAYNQLVRSNDLDLEPVDGVQGWTGYGCTLSASNQPLPNCVIARRISNRGDGPLDVPYIAYAPPIPPMGMSLPPRPASDIPVHTLSAIAPSTVTGNPDVFSVVFGPTCPAHVVECGHNEDVTFGQTVRLGPGRHRVSWYGRNATHHIDAGTTVTAFRPAAVQIASGSNGNVIAGAGVAGTASMPDVAMQNGWVRRSFSFTLTGTQDVRVLVARPVINGITILDDMRVEVAGLMVEALHASTDPASAVPPFIATDAAGQHQMKVCEDITGEEFRREGWNRGCVRLCSTGFGAACPPETGTEYCYWETSFSISERSIERGEQLIHAGFARGNYNYRIDNIGVNFVGTGSRTCEDSSTPSTCYSAGFIPYTIEHLGPYYTRNHFGQWYEAPLHPGVIEHARGLAAERYLTNPISSADQALIGGYMQRQLRGRPLDGTYLLRVWDGPGVNFSGIEDVQLVIDYRFWTRQR